MAGTADPIDSAVSDNVWLSSLMWGTQWESGGGANAPTAITYYVAAVEGPETIIADGRDLTALAPSAQELAAIDAAMASWSAVANIDFVATGSQARADLVWVMDDPRGGYLGIADPPGTADNGDPKGQSLVVVNQLALGPAPGEPGSLAVGGFDYITFVHELGHALGLAHPHDTGGGSGIFPGVGSPFDDYGAFEMNQGLYTVMSYNDGHPAGPLGPSPSRTYGYQAGPMALDIAAVQLMYGANMEWATGDDTYALPTRNATGTYYSCIWDAGGDDTIAGGQGDDAIDLRAATLAFDEGGGGYLSSQQGIHGGYTIANGALIEDAVGGGGDDLLQGNEARNQLVAQGGDDEAWGDLGGDHITGAGGADALYGGNGDDKLKGGDGGDLLDGGAGPDVLQGNNGDDRLLAGGGADLLTGGGGLDDFEFLTPGDSAPADPDTILDFRRGQDDLDVAAIDAKAGTGANDAFALDANGSFSTGEIRQTIAGGSLLIEFNTDSDAAAEMAILLNGLTTPLAAADFIL